ncbi:hypothetical protein RHS01_02516 [Rhizoctonia solani]|uniref:Uncharacterized protein n=1 Tax=Rhizoctonia solani TaxID=456999 RepID=A0A8H7IIW0_9AGAM|nr:hypothetical protein RHS01_02516 [Rhizoctonia solani]
MNARPPDSILRCTHHFAARPSLTFEEAIQFLHQLCSGPGANLTYSWQFIDKPSEGDICVYFQVSAPTPLIDGIHYLDNETTYRPSQELEVQEVRFGFIPGIGEKEAGRVRTAKRAFASNDERTIRNYPLPIINEPPMYVVGEKSGQRVMAPNAVQLANQQQQLDALAASRRHAGMQPQARKQDDDSDEESNRVSTRALAVTRFKRNHELLAEILLLMPRAVPSPYEKTDKAELEAKFATKRELAELTEKLSQEEHDMEDVIKIDETTPAREAPKTST